MQPSRYLTFLSGIENLIIKTRTEWVHNLAIKNNNEAALIITKRLLIKSLAQKPAKY